ncbi:MAG: class I SAM-dependent methyltransferase [bacterium]
MDTGKTKNLIERVITPHGVIWNFLRAIYHFVKSAFRRIAKNGIFLFEGELQMASSEHPLKLGKTLELFNPLSVLDVGCGTGWSIEYLLTRGIDVIGLEGSELAIRKAKHPERIEKCDLRRELNLTRRFDMIWCIEVVEHVHPSHVHNLMRTFVNHSDRVVMSAAKPGQGGEGHFNEQPPEYWIELFAQYGYGYDESSTQILRQLKECYSESMLVFCRKGNLSQQG